MPELPTSREDAKKAGAKTYFNGRCCPHGHLSPRRTINGQCVECTRVGGRERYARHHPERTSRGGRPRKAEGAP